MDYYKLPRAYDKPFDRKDKILSSFVSDLPQIEEAVDPEQRNNYFENFSNLFLVYTGCSEDETTMQENVNTTSLASRIANILMIKEKPLKISVENILLSSKSSSRSKQNLVKHSNTKSNPIGPKTFFSPKYSLFTSKNTESSRQETLHSNYKPSPKSSLLKSPKAHVPYSPSSKIYTYVSSSQRNGDSMCLTLADLTTSTSSRMQSIYSSPRGQNGNGSFSGRTQFNNTPRKNNCTVSLPQTPDYGKFNKLFKGLFDKGASQTNLRPYKNSTLQREGTAPSFFKYKSKSILSGAMSPKDRMNISIGNTSPIHYTPISSPQKKKNISIAETSRNASFFNGTNSSHLWRTSLANLSQLDIEKQVPQPHPEYKSSRSMRNKSLDNNYNYTVKKTPSPTTKIERQKRELDIMMDNLQEEIKSSRSQGGDGNRDSKRLLAQLDITLRKISGLLDDPIKPTHSHSKSASSGIKMPKHVNFSSLTSQINDPAPINENTGRSNKDMEKISLLIEKRVEEIDTQMPAIKQETAEDFEQSIDDIRNKLVDMLNMLN